MVTKSEEKQQSINNIKLLHKLSVEGAVPSLFRQVQRLKEQALKLIEEQKSALQMISRKEENEQKAQYIRQQLKVKQEEAKRSDESFAKLLEEKEQNSGHFAPKLDTAEAKESEVIVEKPKPTPMPQNVKPAKFSSDKPAPRQQQPAYQNAGNRPQFARDNGRNFNKNPNNAGTNQRQYTPSQSGQIRAYSTGAPKTRPNGDKRFDRPLRDKDSRPPFKQNSLVSEIIPKKNAPLQSATSAFGSSKDRSQNNAKHKVERDDEKRINKKSLMRRGLIEEANIEERMVTRKLKLKKTKTEQTPTVFTPITSAVITTNNITVKALSEKIGKPVTELIKQLMTLGVMATINSSIDFTTAELVAGELGITLEQKVEKSYEEQLEAIKDDDGQNSEKRAPIVTIVGHVDHGKTSLLDYIRKTHVTSGEAGGITQAIGAYSITWNGEKITFIDTPGHEAFINMRKRGTEITDVAILIVAGDDGVKPQTVEAIKHIKAAKAPLIVAITKIDKPNIDVERIKQQLTEYEVLPEEWGGDAIFVPVSSVTGQGVDKLLETILLVAEMQELKCNPSRPAIGTVIEASLDKNRGPIANIIVQNGTLKVGDNIMSGFATGKVRAIMDDKGKSIKSAPPSTPVSVLGFDSVPRAGDSVQVVDEKLSKNVIEERRIRMAQEKIESGPAMSLDEFLSANAEENKKKLNILIKADNQGSAEAVKESLLQIENEEVDVEVVYCGVGNINENDVNLAKVSSATIVSFDTKVGAKISNYAKQNKVEIKEYDIIYKAIEDIERLAKSMMTPKYNEVVCGHAEVRALFKISGVGTIAGSYVLDGKIVRNSEVKVYRKNAVIFEGKIATLKREKDDVKEVASGYECGIRIDGYNEIQEGDVIESIIKERIYN